MARVVEASEEIQFGAADRRQLYDWVEQAPVGQQSAQLGMAARGLPGAALVRAAGPISVAQPQGQHAFLRLDTVHQGDQPEGMK